MPSVVSDGPVRSRLKVLHIVNGEHYAGAERVQDLLALSLPEFGYEVGFVALKEGQFARERLSKSAPLFMIPMRGRSFAATASAVADIIAGGYHLVHTHTTRTALVGRAASFFAGTPMIHHVHGPTHADTERRWRNYRNVLSERLSLINVSHCIPVSRHARRYARAIGIPRRRIRLVWNGVPTPQQPRIIDTSGPFIMGTAALFRPKKGIEVLIEALAELSRRSARLVMLNMIGPFENPQYRRAIEDQARDLGVLDRINWIGFTADVYSQLRSLSVFVLPSLYGEGMPMVILEAMAMGLPIVASRVGGIEECLQHDVHGLLVPPGDGHSLASALLAICDGGTNAATFGQNARARQIAEFSDRSMAKGVARVYDEALGILPRLTGVAQRNGGDGQPRVHLRQEETAHHRDRVHVPHDDA